MMPRRLPRLALPDAIESPPEENAHVVRNAPTLKQWTLVKPSNADPEAKELGFGSR